MDFVKKKRDVKNNEGESWLETTVEKKSLAEKIKPKPKMFNKFKNKFSFIN